MKKLKVSPQKTILIFSCLLFGFFLLIPMVTILCKSFYGDDGVTSEYYSRLFSGGSIFTSLLNSVLISALSGLITTILAFIPAYAINYTNISRKLKKVIASLVMLPMLLPTITYGFAIIYSFGKQGLMTNLLGTQLIDIYGTAGLIIGFVIYTLPISFMLINNTMGYVDKKFMIVSRMMGDSKIKSFLTTVITPLISTLAVSFIQSFTLSFTDYGIPAALAGNVDLLATRLYNEMLGSLPDFNTGSAVSIIMLLPSVLSIILISSLNKYNIRYNKISVIELTKNKVRDIGMGIASGVIIACVLSVFAVIFIVPFVEQWPYKMNFSLEHITEILSDSSLMSVYKNSLLTAVVTAVIGTLVVYSLALVSARRNEHRHLGKIPDIVSLVTNTIPGMVLGVAYLLTFKGTFMHNTFAVIIICNIIHYFSSPYLMMKSSLEKLNASWETTAKLMGDSWIKTVIRIITPNAVSTLLEVFSYFFVNAMVTVSAVIFLAGTKTMIITAKIKELQHFANFNEIFVLSILILITNLLVKGLVRLFAAIRSKKGKTV
ncbi:MAG: ABC transporter permease subunit [Oscillospiraceae bacterium]|nr:ABC transporter permease subunit [Oscillospiraceae bacterium]